MLFTSVIAPCYGYKSKCHLPLSLIASHQALHGMLFSLSEISHALFRTKNNPETILLIKEEATQYGCGISLSEIIGNRLTSISVEKLRHS